MKYIRNMTAFWLLISVLLNIALLLSRCDIKKEVPIVPFDPINSVTDKELLNNGFYLVNTDIPILIKDMDSVMIKYELKYFPNNRLGQIVNKYEGFGETKWLNLFEGNKAIGYTCILNFKGNVDSTKIADKLDTYSTNIASQIIEEFELGKKELRFIAYNKNTFKLFNCVLEESGQGYLLRAYYSLK